MVWCHLQHVQVIITVWCPSRLSTHVWLYTLLIVASGNRDPLSVRCTTRCTGPITQPLSHSKKHTETHTHMQVKTHTNRLKVAETQIKKHTWLSKDTYHLHAFLLLWFQGSGPSLTHNRRLGREMKLIHHMKHKHTRTAGIVTFTPQLLSFRRPCLLDAVVAVMTS